MIPADVAREIDRRVGAEEVLTALRRPLGEAERDEVLSLVRWFTGRYRTPQARLAYVRRAYRTWQRATRHRS